MFNIKKCLLFILLPLTILGCNGNDSEEEQLPPGKVAINAQDSLSFSPTKNTQVIDLRQKVTAEDNQELIIDNIESIDNNCTFNKTDIDGLTFKVTTNGANVCRFKYYIKPASSKYKGTSEAIAQVVVTNDYTKGDFLPPVSRTITESASLILDNKSLLIEEGFKLDPNSVYLTGETTSSDIGNFTADDSSITYQAPINTTGTIRIFYTEIDSLNNIARPGVVYIAIGQKGNHSPTALNERLPTIINREKDVPIDITEYISDIDGDELQLIDTKSITGRVEIDSPHSFLYTPGESGREVITYIVSDHNGGYGIGTLIFDIDEYMPIYDTNQDLIFSPPLTINQLSLFGGTYTNSFEEIDVTGYTGVYPTFEKGLAEAYCKTKGMELPSSNSLTRLWNDFLNKTPIFYTDYRWHSGVEYMTRDSGLTAVSLVTGKSTTRSDGYFSCVTDTMEHTWNFLSPAYGGLFNTPTNVFIGSKTGSSTIFLPDDEYNLSYKFTALSVDGELIDPSLAEEYLYVSVTGNTVTVHKKTLDYAIATTLEISDPDHTTSTTKLILGVSLCPLDMDPPLAPPRADELSCILVLHNTNTGTKNEAFTAALSHNMLTILGLKEAQINALGDHEIGKGGARFRAINWSGPKQSTTNEQRQQWLDGLKPVCDALSRLKLDGRNDWASGANNIKKTGGLAIDWFKLSKAEGTPAIDYVHWMQKSDGGRNPKPYGLGYANADASSNTYVNQQEDFRQFKRQSTTQPETNTYPSCWSKG